MGIITRQVTELPVAIWPATGGSEWDCSFRDSGLWGIGPRAASTVDRLLTVTQLHQNVAYTFIFSERQLKSKAK